MNLSSPTKVLDEIGHPMQVVLLRKENSMLFNSGKEKEDPLYAAIRDNKSLCSVKHQLEMLWDLYQSTAPRDFTIKLQEEGCFHQRWWEMYCGVGLKNIGHEVRTSLEENGPDFSFEHNDIWYYIEATAPKCGIGCDQLPDLKMGVNNLPENEFLLRITQAITEKLSQFNKYLDKQLVSKNDILIVAISSCNLSQYAELMDYPVIAPLKVLKGFGNVAINIINGKTGIAAREKIIKKSGFPVDVNFFSREDMRIISGIIYSNSDLRYSPDNPEDTLNLIINPNANCRIDTKIFGGIKDVYS